MKSIVYLLWLSFPELSFSLPIGLVDSLLDHNRPASGRYRPVGGEDRESTVGWVRPGLIDPEPPFLRDEQPGKQRLGTSLKQPG